MAGEYDDNREEEDEEAGESGKSEASEQTPQRAEDQVDEPTDLFNPGIPVYNQAEVAPKLVRFGFKPLGPLTSLL